MSQRNRHERQVSHGANEPLVHMAAVRLEKRAPSLHHDLVGGGAQSSERVDRGMQNRLPRLVSGFVGVAALSSSGCVWLGATRDDASFIGQPDVLELDQVIEHLVSGGRVLVVEQVVEASERGLRRGQQQGLGWLIGLLLALRTECATGVARADRNEVGVLPQRTRVVARGEVVRQQRRLDHQPLAPHFIRQQLSTLPNIPRYRTKFATDVLQAPGVKLLRGAARRLSLPSEPLTAAQERAAPLFALRIACHQARSLLT